MGLYLIIMRTTQTKTNPNNQTEQTKPNKMKRRLQSLALALALLLPSATMANKLVEVENFDSRGGWRLDHQAFPQIGSAYLLAHGLGKPVEKDPTTEVKFDEAGKYHLYVSTYNWTAPWYDGKGPGAFTLSVNGKVVGKELGTEGKSWGWQYAGAVSVKAGANSLSLHDLTGFGARADAIYFSKSKKTPPEGYEALHDFRRTELGYAKAKECGKYDLVVVGGGVAGCATALSAARYGLKVALVDNLPGLGGNHYLSVRLCGIINENLYPKLGNMVRQLSGLPIPQTAEELENEPHKKGGGGTGHLLNVKGGRLLANDRKKTLLSAGVKVFQNIHVYQVAKSGEKITSVTGKHLVTNEDMKFDGALFADCTGDGVVGYLSGAEFRIGRESKAETGERFAPEVADQQKMGSTLWWNARESASGKDTTFPSISELPWAAQCDDSYHQDVVKGGWFWETGFEQNNAEEMEAVRDNLVRAVIGNWAFIKAKYPEKYHNFDLVSISQVAMKRESRRLMGDIVLSGNDIDDRREFPDASFTTTWMFDLHYAEEKNKEKFPEWPWIAHNKEVGMKQTFRPSYHVPYRVLYSKDIDNLFIGGRCMSVTHMALGTVRVMATLGMAGEVTGMAAKICVDNKTSPRGVYKDHLEQLKRYMSEGAPLE